MTREPLEFKISKMFPGNEALIIGAPELFDYPPKKQFVERFLKERGHHLLMAVVEDRSVGFVSGVEMTHPDKGTEMFIYELSVDPKWRRQGIAKALLEELILLSKNLDCYGMWVLTDDDNVAANRTYKSTGADNNSTHIMYEWTWK